VVSSHIGYIGQLLSHCLLHEIHNIVVCHTHYFLSLLCPFSHQVLVMPLVMMVMGMGEGRDVKLSFTSSANEFLLQFSANANILPSLQAI